ncbi:MAG: hypothetical protein PWP08_806 [Methanofollis sp.]|nr:hypothetical protein [Methanofollis sp.]
MSLIILNERNLLFASVVLGLLAGVIGSLFATAVYHRQIEHLSNAKKEQFYRVCYGAFAVVLLFLLVMVIYTTIFA